MFIGGINYNYCINLTADAPRNYTSITDCYGEGDVNWFTDASNINNNQTDGHFENMIIARNAAKVNSAFMLAYSARRFAALDNIQFGGGVQMFRNESSHADQDQVAGRNRCYGAGIQRHRQVHYTEFVGNIAYDPDTDVNLIEYSGASIVSGSVFDDNNLYGPNDTDGDIVRDFDVPAYYTLSEFNTQAGYTNTSSDPGWTDPANGDFT